MYKLSYNYISNSFVEILQKTKIREYYWNKIIFPIILFLPFLE